MKKQIISFLFILLSSGIFAQSPGLINYQTIIRNTAGNPLTDKDFQIRISIYQSSPNGNLVYQENHEKTTNDFGLINMQIGSGTVNFGELTLIDWSNGPYFIETAVDSTNNFNYVVIGNSQLLSVPYALHANTVDNTDDADADPTNEIQNLELNGNKLSIENGNTINIPTDGVWNENDDNIYFENGFVGIGTPNPLTPFQIDGYSNGNEGRTFMSIYNKTSDPWSAANVRFYSGENTESFLQMAHRANSYSVVSELKNTSFIWNRGEGLILQSTDYPNSCIRFNTNSQSDYIERMRIDAFGNIGIATDDPKTKLHLAEGDIYLENINSSIIMKSPNGQCWKITVNNDGSLNTNSVECP